MLGVNGVLMQSLCWLWNSAEASGEICTPDLRFAFQEVSRRCRNLGSDYESGALTNYATEAQAFFYFSFLISVSVLFQQQNIFSDKLGKLEVFSCP